MKENSTARIKFCGEPESTVELIQGKRYWLDVCKDVSGVYHGLGSKGELLFKDQQGKLCYCVSDDGFMRFSYRLDFFLVEPDQNQ